ncbi:MAG TPA: TetR/AcrR family transcriptional regulator, partial [Vicinamibacteria bacterium]
MSAAARATAPRRGRKAAASREDVIRAATRNYLRGQRVDVQGIAADLGLGRSTVYRWFGSREELIGEVLVAAAGPLLDAARSGARGHGG